MPVRLDSQKAVRELRDLPFCYICGEAFGKQRETNFDHVPPTGLFAQKDRDFPIVFPTHQGCNTSQSADDQVMAQLVGLMHGRQEDPRHIKLELSVGERQDGSPVVAASKIQLRRIIQRWVRAFHAGLYREYLPRTTKFSTCLPVPEMDRQKGDYSPVSPVFSQFVAEIKRNRATGTLDMVNCRNGKCRFECVWTQADNGDWMCIYGLDVYGWIELGDTFVEQRGCVGCYFRPTGGTPPEATCATKLIFPFGNRERTDPFGE